MLGLHPYLIFAAYQDGETVKLMKNLQVSRIWWILCLGVKYWENSTRGYARFINWTRFGGNMTNWSILLKYAYLLKNRRQITLLGGTFSHFSIYVCTISYNRKKCKKLRIYINKHSQMKQWKNGCKFFFTAFIANKRRSQPSRLSEENL